MDDKNILFLSFMDDKRLIFATEICLMTIEWYDKRLDKIAYI